MTSKLMHKQNDTFKRLRAVMKDVNGNHRQIIKTMQDQIDYLMEFIEIQGEILEEKTGRRQPELSEDQKTSGSPWQKVERKKERSGSASKSLKNDNSARTYLHILKRSFVGISTLHTSKSTANSRCQGLKFTAVPLTGIAL